ncbi:O-antigen ligase family protein [Serpentinicella sp. ANB-PHB4]|uniref:O-antigen ligase family protein n=1 Tax=Serpentinicella sp. ANB-PHB4 TaxID=3074076 RepID=UPI0028549AFC|nr:O-antigen ligase family protein [Serpentinicella sp. ANB-PHB4]MDR5658776.1 O-antigen ligase family protein [Serpentinicella sp. ANB-PHB4]
MNRLQFPFQYANAAGIFFAAIALSMRFEKEKKAIKYIPIIEVALLLTQSIGAIASYVVGIGLSIMFTQKKEKTEIYMQINQNLTRLFISTVFAVGIYISRTMLDSSIVGGVVMGTLIVTCRYYITVVEKVFKYKMNYVFYAISSIGVIFIFSTDRLMQGSQTFVERLIQITDGGRAILSNPLVGLGPGNWQYLKGQWQTAQYTATHVHSSVIQIGVDAGIIAIIAVLLLIIILIKRLNRKNVYLTSAATIVLLHSVFDFTLSFLSINLLLITLILSSFNVDKNKSTIKRTYVVVPIGLVAILLVYSFFGQVTMQKAQRATSAGHYMETISIFEKKPALLKNSYPNQLVYVESLFVLGQNEKSLSLAKNLKYNTVEKHVIGARILEEKGAYEDAVNTLMSGIELTPYELDLYEYARYLINEKIPEDKINKHIKMYNYHVEKSTKQQSILVQYLDNQHQIPLLP